jgi:hypothetical protein
MKFSAFLLYGSGLPLLFGACEPARGPEQSLQPKPDGLEGRWHYDSTGVEVYDATLQHVGGSCQRQPAGEVLTIGAGRWEYSGTLHEVHTYARQGRALVIRRIGTRRMVELGYITAERIGHVLFQDTFDLVGLTPTHLTIRDSSQVVDPNCSPGRCYTVYRQYYSR